MSLFRSLAGTVRAEVTGADIYGSLKKLSDENLKIQDIVTVDELTVRFTVSGNDLNRIKALCRKRGDAIRVIAKMGIRWKMETGLKRPILVIGLLLLTVFACCLPSRILIVQVQGNSGIPLQQILEKAAECGIHFGASRRLVRSEQMKNSLLGAIPELQWTGINTYGCRAVISVRERPVEEAVSESAGVSSIVASLDGVVTDCTVMKGNACCAPGQAVNRGQILISGYTDCGITIQATRAEGEIMALTKRELKAVTPSVQQLRTVKQQPKRFYSLTIGKKRINFYKGSGISGGSCVKMYSKYVLTLPGGFEMPLSLVVETIAPADVEPDLVSEPEEMLRKHAKYYLSEQMIAGRILETEEQIHKAEEIVRLVGRYACLESIGQRREEKIGEHNGEANGTDRQRGSGG